MRTGWLMLLLLMGCAQAPVPKGDAGGMTVAIKTTNKLACKVTPPDIIATMLSAPTGYATDDNSKPVPMPVTDQDEEEKPKPIRRDVCYPGWKEWRGKRWKCRYER